MFNALDTLIANFDRVVDFVERLDKRGTTRLGKFSTTFGALCLIAAVLIQLVMGERVVALGFAGLGTIATTLGVSWLVSRRWPPQKRGKPRLEVRRNPRASLGGTRPKSLPRGKDTEPVTASRKAPVKRSKTTRR